MDTLTLFMAMAWMMSMPDNAASSAADAADAADRAETAADSISTGTLAEFKQYIGIS